MVFGLFSQKKEVKKLKAEFAVFENNLEDAFKNIKNDMVNVSKWITTLDKNDKVLAQLVKDQQNRLDNLETQFQWLVIAIEDLKQVKQQYLLEASETKKKRYESEEENEGKVTSSHIIANTDEELVKSLTSTQLELFQTITVLTEGSGEKVCTPQQVAKIMYPKRPYETVRTTVSAYITMLEDFRLIKKERKGRYIYLILTEKALHIIKKLKEKKKLKSKIIN